MRNECPAIPREGQERWFFKISASAWILFLICFSLSQLFFFCCSDCPMLTQREPLHLTPLTSRTPESTLLLRQTSRPGLYAPCPRPPCFSHQQQPRLPGCLAALTALNLGTRVSIGPGLSPPPGSRSGWS